MKRINKTFNYTTIVSVDTIVETGTAFTYSCLRYWLFHRNKNGLRMAVVEIGGSLFIDVLNFNCWLSQDKDEVSNFLNLRTRKQILATSRIKPSKLDAWLKVRWTNGLHEAVIAKGPRKLYIDIHKLNRWLMEQNKNAGFGQLHIEELAG